MATAAQDGVARVNPCVIKGAGIEPADERPIGVEHLHLHDLRHVAGTLAATTGAGTRELMYRLGHASPQAALRYQHAIKARDVAIADAMDVLIANGSVLQADP